MVAMSAGHEFVGGTLDSGIMSSAADVLGMRGVDGVCESLWERGSIGRVSGFWSLIQNRKSNLSDHIN